MVLKIDPKKGLSLTVVKRSHSARVEVQLFNGKDCVTNVGLSHKDGDYHIRHIVRSWEIQFGEGVPGIDWNLIREGLRKIYDKHKPKEE